MMNMMEDSQHEVGLGGVKSEPIEVDHQVEDTVGVSTETIKVQTGTNPVIFWFVLVYSA